jgi:UDP-N-acetylglucosamine--N-acetylmuramyl-(pentapeptide) pyrophosphoryl-undecaprenol N-acetylglucosamine transferase
MTGGGSAGHITPILSVATELKKTHPLAHIRYVGQKGDKLNSLVKDADGFERSYAIFAGKWRRYHGISIWAHLKDWRTILKNIRDLFLFVFGFFQSVWLLLRWRPNVIFVKGGYVGLPVGLAAAVLGIAVVTHDSDALPGLTNRILARFARKQCVGLPAQYYRQYNQQKVVQTGVPASDKYRALSDTETLALKKHLQLAADAQVLTIFGGSLGAIRLNEAVLEAAPVLLSQLPKLHILHVTGKAQAEEIAIAYGTLNDELARRVWCWPFLPNLYEITGIADVVIARAGATSIAELGLQHKAVILVPNPYLVGGHQTYNARLVEDNDAAIVVSEKQLHDPTYSFEGTILNLLKDTIRQKELGLHLSKLGMPNAAANIAGIIVEVAN